MLRTAIPEISSSNENINSTAVFPNYLSISYDYDGLYSVSDIQYYFDYITLKHEAVIDKVNKIETGITLEVKTGYALFRAFDT